MCWCLHILGRPKRPASATDCASPTPPRAQPCPLCHDCGAIIITACLFHARPKVWMGYRVARCSLSVVAQPSRGGAKGGAVYFFGTQDEVLTISNSVFLDNKAVSPLSTSPQVCTRPLLQSCMILRCDAHAPALENDDIAFSLGASS